jgi:hypothetical protein
MEITWLAVIVTGRFWAGTEKDRAGRRTVYGAYCSAKQGHQAMATWQKNLQR